jgi:hypothetical protein
MIPHTDLIGEVAGGNGVPVNSATDFDFWNFEQTEVSICVSNQTLFAGFEEIFKIFVISSVGAVEGFFCIKQMQVVPNGGMFEFGFSAERDVLFTIVNLFHSFQFLSFACALIITHGASFVKRF